MKATVDSQGRLIAALTGRIAALEARGASSLDTTCKLGAAMPSVATEATDASMSPPKAANGRMTKAWGGGGEPCAICGKTVYAAEKILARGTLMHRDCFRCARCDTRLVNSPNWEIHSGTCESLLAAIWHTSSGGCLSYEEPTRLSMWQSFAALTSIKLSRVDRVYTRSIAHRSCES